MELVYLWVEKYKNIENQGFNFSPRFECEYKDDNLTINEKKDYVHVFPKNINVTAIVGENGSGKSRLLELISFFRFERLKRNKNLFFIVYFYKKELFVILNTKKDYHSFDIFNLKSIYNKTQYKINDSNAHQKLFSLCFFSNGLSTFTDNDRLISSNHYDCFYNGCDNTMKFEYKFGYLLQQKSDFFKLLNKNFIFNTMRLELNLKDININSNNEDTKEKIRKLRFYFENNIDISSFTLGEEKNDPTKEVYVYNFLAFFFLNIYIDLVDDFSNEFNQDFRNVFLDDFITKIQNQLDEKNKNDNSIPYNIAILDLLIVMYKKLKETIFDIFKDQRGQLDHFNGKTKEMETIEEFQDTAKFIFSYFELDINSNILISKSEKIQTNNLNKYQDFFSKNTFFTYLSDYGILKINFFDRNAEINFLDLSTGEQQLITFIVNFTYTLIKTDENRIILLDEIETSLHPQWQKEILFLIVNYIDFMKHTKLIRENEYHLLLTSHSPFILSDIPKENVIFLEKDRTTGNCKNVTNEINMNTFGANIHTLLSHGFFMKDGLMGEFAKKQIRILNIAHKYITHKHRRKYLSKQPCKRARRLIIKKMPCFWHIQSIIGEDFLQTIIKNQLQEIELLLLNKHDAIDKEIERLKQLKESVSQ